MFKNILFFASLLVVFYAPAAGDKGKPRLMGGPARDLLERHLRVLEDRKATEALPVVDSEPSVPTDMQPGAGEEQLSVQFTALQRAYQCAVAWSQWYANLLFAKDAEIEQLKQWSSGLEQHIARLIGENRELQQRCLVVQAKLTEALSDNDQLRILLDPFASNRKLWSGGEGDPLFMRADTARTPGASTEEPAALSPGEAGLDPVTAAFRAVDLELQNTDSKN